MNIIEKFYLVEHLIDIVYILMKIKIILLL